MNLAVNTALAPTKGIALPFISHGSTGLSIALFQVGILVAIARVSKADHDDASGRAGASVERKPLGEGAS